MASVSEKVLMLNDGCARRRCQKSECPLYSESTDGSRSCMLAIAETYKRLYESTVSDCYRRMFGEEENDGV